MAGFESKLPGSLLLLCNLSLGTHGMLDYLHVQVPQPVLRQQVVRMSAIRMAQSYCRTVPTVAI